MSNKNDILTLSILILIFLLFALNSYKINSIEEYKILNIDALNNLYIDFNKNLKVDKNEKTKLNDIKLYTTIKNNYSENEAKKLEISIEDYLKAGYLTHEFLKENYLNKNVIITNKKYDAIKQVYTATLKDKDIDLAQILLKNGLAYIDKETQNANYLQFYNPKQSKLNIKEISQIKFFIKNNNNKIVHDLTCKFSKLIKNGEITTTKDQAKQCSVCSYYSNRKEAPKESLAKRKFNLATHKKFENFELFLIDPHKETQPNKNCTSEICKAIIQEINSAQKSIDIALYGIGEQEGIYNALENAQNRNVQIRIVLDKSKNTENMYPNSKIFAQKFPSNKDDEESLMHNKFFVFDDKKVLTGSANLSSTDTGGYSANIMALIKSKEVARYYKAEFEQMYSGKFSTRKSKITKKPLITGNNSIEIFFTPKENILEEKILPLIKNAQKEILVSIFYLTHKEIIKELINAKNRNVDVLVLIDAIGAGNFKERIDLLRNAKIPVKVENWGGKNHEKTMVVDEKYLLFGSSNFSKNALTKNDENIVIIKNEDISKYYKKYFTYLFDSIDSKYLSKYPLAESLESINSCYDGIDNDFDGKIDYMDSACKAQSK